MDAIAAVTTRYYYDDQRIVLQTEYDGQTQTDRTFVYGNYIDEVLVMSVIPAQAGIQNYYYAHDHLYSTVVLFDNTGAVVERYEYDAYGAVHIMDASYNSRSASSYGNSCFFTGRELDTLDSGNLKIMYYRARYYTPATGRFLQRDPLEYVDGMNLYEYVGSVPTTHLDPEGLFYDYVPNPWDNPIIWEIEDFWNCMVEKIKPKECEWRTIAETKVWRFVKEEGYWLEPLKVPGPRMGGDGNMTGGCAVVDWTRRYKSLDQPWIASHGDIAVGCTCTWENERIEEKYCCGQPTGKKRNKRQWEPVDGTLEIVRKWKSRGDRGDTLILYKCNCKDPLGHPRSNEQHLEKPPIRSWF